MKKFPTAIGSASLSSACPRWSAAVCLMALLFLSVFPVTVLADQKHDPYAPLKNVPESARTRKNPFEGGKREATAGGKLFDDHCADCHGRKAGGTRRGPSLLRPEIQQASPGTLFWILTNGVVWHGMPVWSKLPEPERWQIVTFIQSLNSHPSDKHPNVP